MEVGCALPNTQFFTSEIEQLNHARSTNARIGRYEPATTTLHRVERTVEAGGEWPPFGVSADSAGVPAATGAAVTHACVAAFDSLRRGERITDAQDLPTCTDLHGLAVSLYRPGRIAGCWVAFGRNLVELVPRATRGAFEDGRLASDEDKAGDAILLVSVLVQGEWIGRRSVEAVARRLRLGRDTVVGGFGRVPRAGARRCRPAGSCRCRALRTTTSPRHRRRPDAR